MEKVHQRINYNFYYFLKLLKIKCRMIVMIENLLNEVKREKFKLYSQIIDNLEDLKLDKEQS